MSATLTEIHSCIEQTDIKYVQGAPVLTSFHDISWHSSLRPDDPSEILSSPIRSEYCRATQHGGFKYIELTMKTGLKGLTKNIVVSGDFMGYGLERNLSHGFLHGWPHHQK